MAFNISRYYNRKHIEAEFEVLTPLFLGNADQEAELRSPPFKYLMRYWWRVTQHEKADPSSLLEAESRLFGSAGEDGDGATGKSPIKISVSLDKSQSAKPCKDDLPLLKKIHHPECRHQNGMINPLLYLGGMGLMKNASVTHSYYRSGLRFKVNIDYDPYVVEQVRDCLSIIQAFGALGSRCRNGWGSIQMVSGASDIDNVINLLQKFTRPWEQGLEKDYPNCLGQDDDKKPLLWKTTPQESWEQAMRELADAYAALRARPIGAYPRINPGTNTKPGERHLLGVPLTNHSGGWPKNARHASPLRFVIRRKDNQYRGFILHLPYKFSSQMHYPPGIDQKAFWEKVHSKLDAIGNLKRAEYKDCL